MHSTSERITSERIAARPPDPPECPRAEFAATTCEEIRRQVFPHYKLDARTDCRLYKKGLNDTYLLSGSGRRFALRVYHPQWRDRSAIRGELAALAHAHAKGIAVAMPRATANGNLITAVKAADGLRNAVLFHWVEGEEPAFTDSHAMVRYGRFAAELHVATSDFADNDSRPRLNRRYLLEQPLAQIRTAMPCTPELNLRLQQLEARCERLLEEAGQCLPDWGFCHGDLYIGNLRMRNDRCVMFDFDMCGTGWRAFDLASFKWAARLHKQDAAAWPPFLQGYLQVRDVAASTLKFVPLFMILRHLWNCAAIVRFHRDIGIEQLAATFLADMVSFCEGIEQDVSPL